MNLPGTTEALYKCREDIRKLYNHSNFFIDSKVIFFFSKLPVFKKVTTSGKISLGEKCIK